MEKEIRNGQVKGMSVISNKTKDIVKEGHFTYAQAKNHQQSTVGNILHMMP